MTDPSGDRFAEFKKQAGERAAALITSGMVVGLGTGSTAVYATRRLGELLASGVLSNVVGFPTSRSTAQEAARLSIPLLSEDLADGTDYGGVRVRNPFAS